MRGEPNDCSFIRTYTGKYFWPLEPRPEDVDIEDIAHALSNQCRWTGHVKEFYSVAQHCSLVAQYVSPANKLWALLHDASEAYLVDLARPIKYTNDFGQRYRQIEAQIEMAICVQFGLPVFMPTEVKEMDNVLLWTEKRDLMAGDWKWPVAAMNGWQTDAPKTLVQKIEPLSPHRAKHNFLHDYYEYGMGSK